MLAVAKTQDIKPSKQKLSMCANKPAGDPSDKSFKTINISINDLMINYKAENDMQ